MGVGLSICRSIIELHGGRIWISDNPGGGTIFHFTVPCIPATEQHDVTYESMSRSAVPAA